MFSEVDVYSMMDFEHVKQGLLASRLQTLYTLGNNHISQCEVSYFGIKMVKPHLGKTFTLLILFCLLLASNLLCFLFDSCVLPADLCVNCALQKR